MDDTTLDEIKSTAHDLDAKVPKEGAAVQFVFVADGGTPDESLVEANRLGYLRMGIEFLKAAFARTGTGSRGILDASIDHLTTEQSQIRFIGLARNEDLRPPPPRGVPTIKDRLLLLGCAIVVLIVGFLVISGVMFWSGLSLSD